MLTGRSSVMYGCMQSSVSMNTLVFEETLVEDLSWMISVFCEP